MAALAAVADESGGFFWLEALLRSGIAHRATVARMPSIRFDI
jgi:hypothetical protein